ncbi:hypothetical protein [Naasia aerilata]|uniref:hypothetical protein n=1 Tax=Naasia aerilata TaxID=1162966 RepID=UPI0025738EC4|nr:hypothetical protein [Naasia aerilata]
MPNMTIHYELTEREEREIAGARASQARVAGAIGSFIPGVSRPSCRTVRACTTRAR